jgi:hypothetical protein
MRDAGCTVFAADAWLTGCVFMGAAQMEPQYEQVGKAFIAHYYQAQILKSPIYSERL